jgi:hypothetical protein
MLWKALKLVPPWVWVGAGAAVVTAGVAVGAFIYQKAVLSTLASVKEQIFARNVWQTETNLKMDKETIQRDATFKQRIEAIERRWK